MRLLHSRTLELQDFPNYTDISFEILSHTWADGEVLFEDIRGLNATTIPPHTKSKLGYKKVEACSAQAARDGFEWVWIDTCCIDKSSSAELSEAINSMYRWYRDSAVCYVYLADVPNNADIITKKEKFRESRWFSRGWTLQELIAPRSVEFYGDQWCSQGQKASLGTKCSLEKEISDITKIPIKILGGSNSGSVAQKMSWASQRKTSRIEDRAYSLLGLFGINMSLLYGEGNRAFIRLQEEILKISADESLFAWRGSRQTIFQRGGILAISPDDFVDSGGISSIHTTLRSNPFTVTNRGLRLEVILRKASDILEASTTKVSSQFHAKPVLVLNCHEEKLDRLIGILLVRSGLEEDAFERIQSTELVMIDRATYQPLGSDLSLRTIFVTLVHSVDIDKTSNDKGRIPGREGLYGAVWLKKLPDSFRLAETWPRNLWHAAGETLLEGIWIPDLMSKHSAALCFDNENVAFVIAMETLFGEPLVQILEQAPGAAISALTINVRENYQGKGVSDRASHRLSTGEIVSASFRPQQANGRLGYSLSISIDKSPRSSISLDDKTV
jgi:hypothetical protein